MLTFDCKITRFATFVRYCPSPRNIDAAIGPVTSMTLDATSEMAMFAPTSMEVSTSSVPYTCTTKAFDASGTKSVDDGSDNV